MRANRSGTERRASERIIKLEEKIVLDRSHGGVAITCKRLSNAWSVDDLWRRSACG